MRDGKQIQSSSNRLPARLRPNSVMADRAQLRVEAAAGHRGLRKPLSAWERPGKLL
jgi:hypothetical protein